MRTAFERAGDVRSVDLLAAFATLWRERATGVLTFSRPQHRVRFEILEGAVLEVSSSDPAFDTAEVLVRAGKLDAAVLEGRRLPAGRDRARAAREIGLLTERDWRWGEKIRAVEILSDLIGWLEGTYKLDPFERPEVGEFRLGIERLLLELFLRSRDRAFIHQSLGAVDAPLQRAADFDQEFPALGLTSEALAVIEAIDGRATAAEIPRRVAPDPFSVEKLLAALTTLGLVHPEYAAEAPPSAKRTTPGPAPPAPPPEPPHSPAAPVAAAEVAEAPGESGTELAVEVSPPGDEASREKAAVAEPEMELPLAPSPEPSHPEPLVTSWEQEPAGPMDQPLELHEPPAFPRSRRPSLTPVWLLVVLAIAVGALLFFRARERGAGAAGVPSVAPTAIATSAAVVITEALPIVAPPTPVPPTIAPPTPVPPTEVPPTPVPRTATPRPLPTEPPPTAAAPEPPPIGRRQWLARAGRDRRLLLRDRRTRYTIQLELVCELASLDEAWRYDRRGAMWLLTASYRGRECFRVFWGRYATLDEARAAKSGVPRFFFTPTNQPVVVSTRGALLR